MMMVMHSSPFAFLFLAIIIIIVLQLCICSAGIIASATGAAVDVDGPATAVVVAAAAAAVDGTDKEPPDEPWPPVGQNYLNNNSNDENNSKNDTEPNMDYPQMTGHHSVQKKRSIGEYPAAATSFAGRHRRDCWEEPRKRSRNRVHAGDAYDRWNMRNDDGSEEADHVHYGRVRYTRGSGSDDTDEEEDRSSGEGYFNTGRPWRHSDERREHYGVRHPSHSHESHSTRHRHHRYRPSHPYHRPRPYSQERFPSPPVWTKQSFPPAIIFRLPPPSSPQSSSATETVATNEKQQRRQHQQQQQQHEQIGSAPTETQPQPSQPLISQHQQQQQRPDEQLQQKQHNELESTGQQLHADNEHMERPDQQQQQGQPLDQQQQPPPPPPAIGEGKQQPPPSSSATTQTDNSEDAQKRRRRPSRCPRKAIEKCSAFSKCADGSGLVLNCWHKGDDMVFDETTQECRSFMTLPDCLNDFYCAGRPTGTTALGGACSKVAIICGVPQQQKQSEDGDNVRRPLVCRGTRVLDPRDKDSCVEDRRVPDCAELL